VDSQSLVSNLNGISTEAAGAILSGTQADTCALVGAINLKPTGLAEYLCVFGDDSKLNLSILRNQPDLPDRIRLKEILLAR
jgi:hypothetical protein